MISVEEAKTIILQVTSAKTPCKVTLAEALGCILAQNITAQINLPRFHNSAMDGYALRAEDTRGARAQHPKRLATVGEVRAGSITHRPIRAGECIRIMTGAPLPEGSDAVIAVEDVKEEGDCVDIFHEVSLWDNVRLEGEDVKVGEALLTEGMVVTPQRIALLAGQGYQLVRVIPRLQVAILTTGDELAQVGDTLGPAQIWDSNSWMLQALVRDVGADPVVLGIARDARQDLTRKIKEGLRYDALLIAGGVSVGRYDIVKSVLHDEEVVEYFWRIKVKPGMPTFFGKHGHTLIFGLPGNPASSFVNFEVLVKPALCALMGKEPDTSRWVQAEARRPISKKAGKTHFVRAVCETENGHYMVEPSGHQGSHSLKSLAQANALMMIPEDTLRVNQGDKVITKLLGVS